MNFGFVRVGAVVPSGAVADVKGNCHEAINMIKQAAEKDASVVLFPELSITFSSCGDLFFTRNLIEGAIKGLDAILQHTKQLPIVSILGMPVSFQDRLYNCAVVISKGKILGIVPKTYFSKESYQHRYFAAWEMEDKIEEVEILSQKVPFGTNLLFKHISGLCFGIEICEDLSANNPPSAFHSASGANIIFNLSANSASAGKNSYIDSLVVSRSLTGQCGYVYTSCGACESTTDLLYSGYIVIAENGKILLQNSQNSFTSKLEVMEIDLQRLSAERLKKKKHCKYIKKLEYKEIEIPFVMKPLEELVRKIEPYPFIPERDQAVQLGEIFDIQAFSLAKRLKHLANPSPVIGVSGGLDSTLALLVCAKAVDILGIPRDKIIAITMPGFGTTKRTYLNAKKLMYQLEVTSMEVDIKLACKMHLEDIGLDLNDHSTAYENAQARERTQVLMDIANKHNGVVIGTSDLSELALGWTTYGGDHISMYSVNSSVPKTLVRHLVRWAGENMIKDSELIVDILDTPVSPELMPTGKDGRITQKTEDIIGNYEIHDFFLYYFIRFGFTPKKLEFLANCAFKGIYDKEVIKNCLNIFISRFFDNQFKRSCMPDGPKVGHIALSPRMDWRMPSDAVKSLWMEW